MQASLPAVMVELDCADTACQPCPAAAQAAICTSGGQSGTAKDEQIITAVAEAVAEAYAAAYVDIQACGERRTTLLTATCQVQSTQSCCELAEPAQGPYSG